MRQRAPDWALILFLAAVPLGLAARLATGWALPFWFDEVYTGTIAGQPSAGDLLRWCLSELTGPAFYAPMWLWAKLAGTSNAALRLPALLLSVAAPALIAWRGYPDRRVRLYWATFSMLWMPMLAMSTEARPYPQLFLLGALQCTFFLEVMRAPSHKSAWRWTLVTAAFVLTHYYALLISAFEGLALLMAHRRRLLSFYPAVIPLCATGIWMLFHLGTVLSFGAAHAAHFEPLSLIDVTALPWFVFGQGPHAFAILILIASTSSFWWPRIEWRSPGAQLVLCAIGAFTVIFVAGLFRAVLMPRYVTPCIPAILFGLACWVAQARVHHQFAVAGCFAVSFGAMAATLLFGSSDIRFRERQFQEFETASAWLLERPPERLYYVRAGPAYSPAEEDRMKQVASFFFHRAGRSVNVIFLPPLHTSTAAVGDDKGAAVLFSSSAAPHEQSVRWLTNRSRDWKCRQFGERALEMVVCRREPVTRHSPQAL